MKLSALLTIVITLAVSLIALPAQAQVLSNGSGLGIDKLELKHTKVLPLAQGKVASVKRDAGRAAIPVTMALESYNCRLLRVTGTDTQVKWSRTIYRYVLLSKDEKTSYSWSTWTRSAYGHFTLLSGENGQNYLAWAYGPDVLFAEVSKGNESWARLEAYVSPQEKALPDDITSVPVGHLIRETWNWGGSSFYSAIDVRSIAKNQAGNWVVEISGPKGDRIYTIVSDATELGWHLEGQRAVRR